MRARYRQALVIAVGLCALAAAPAQAARFCVADPACVTAGGASTPTLQSAFDQATANGAGLDQVEIGAVSLPLGGTVHTPVELIGEGQSLTTVDGGPTVLTLSDPASSIRDLTVHIGGNDIGAIATSGDVTRVTATGGSTEFEAAIILNGGTGSDVTVSLPLARDSSAVRMGDGATLDGATLTASAGIGTGGEGETIRDVRLEVGSVGIQAGIFSGGPTTIENSLVWVRDPGGGAGLSAVPPFMGGRSTLIARHVTVVGIGAGVGAGAGGTCFPSGAASSTLVLRDTILDGFESDLSIGGSDSCGAAGSIDAAYSLFDPESIRELGPGEVVSGPGNVNDVPRFAAPVTGDFHLTFGSPAIDAGEPGPPTAGEAATDLDGNPRVVDGDSDGIARRDMGAYEAAVGTSSRRFARTLKIEYATRSETFKGKIRSAGAPCRKGKVRIYLKRRRGSDDLVGSDRSTGKGKFSLREDAKDGTYYAEIRPSESAVARCDEARSKNLKVR